MSTATNITINWDEVHQQQQQQRQRQQQQQQQQQQRQQQQISRRPPDWRWTLEEIGILKRAIQTNQPFDAIVSTFRSIGSIRKTPAIEVRLRQEIKRAHFALIAPQPPQQTTTQPSALTTTTTTQPSALTTTTTTQPSALTTTTTTQPPPLTTNTTTQPTSSPPPAARTLNRQAIMKLVGDIIEISKSALPEHLKQEMQEMKRQRIETNL
jgi:hypothetical protein